MFPDMIPLVNTKVCLETGQSGHSCLNRQVVFGELCYITFDHKKHLLERIVPLRVPLPGSSMRFFVHVEAVMLKITVHVIFGGLIL